MSVGGIGPGTGGAGPLKNGSSRSDTLKQVARDFEAVFLQQMLKAMRETVPEGGLIDMGRSEEMFTGLLDEHIANVAADRSERGIGAALYRQLVGRVQP